MEPQPFFSIIIPTLNEEKYLPNLLSDLSQQTHRDFEIIVVDGHSEDRTRERAMLFKNKLPTLNLLDSSKRNVSFQRNLGAKSAKGKYILFIDADSRLPSYFLSGLIYRLKSKPSDIFTCWIRADDSTTSAKTIASITNIFLETAYLLDSPAALGAMIGCKKEVFTKTRGFDPKIGFAEDTEFVKRASKKGFHFKIYRDPQFIFSWRRFKRTGTIKTLQKYALLNLKRLVEADINQEKDYPMGGKVTISDQSTQNLVNKIINTLDTGKKIPSILKKIKAIITLTEEE